MARRYSYDLRMNLFKALDEGPSIVKACKIFNISRNTIYRRIMLVENMDGV
ncbi:IS630 family transposase [Orientia tsutsugamushi]|uniref:IS630 family transposase n=1 Tax=Orientia tsutsugamushi TaxID=784 RepID=A0A2U3RQW3_ORITS|nr:transposase family protein [Orientia tsutsugamushi str. Karp]SPR15611.1 IS630 family transposase [Orientia tsutsugamushi]SPR16021.1 IS630 family transposase [Orientia tsutsugamushi]